MSSANSEEAMAQLRQQHKLMDLLDKTVQIKQVNRTATSPNNTLAKRDVEVQTLRDDSYEITKRELGLKTRELEIVQ